MECYVTDAERTFERSTKLLSFSPKTPEMRLVKVYPTITYQEIVGFGAALTEASGYVFSQMSDENKQRFCELCFGVDNNCYSLCRLSIQSCDFSLGPRAYLDDKDDEAMETFSIDGDRDYVLPLVKAAQQVNPNLSFFATPWSPPAWAKTNRSMKLGGRLREGAQSMWARMVARYLRDYEAEGIVIDRISVQNEPNARQTWESCLFNAKQEAEFVRDHLRPALDEAGLQRVKIFIWDHNKEGVIDRARSVLADEATAAAVEGVAFHWYSGDHFEALQAAAQLIGDRELIFSEGCDCYTALNPQAEIGHAEHYAREIVGDLKAGAHGIIDWNILLDEQGGPNHVANWCDAPIMYDRETGQLVVRRPFHYLGHFSRFIRPGARRILVSSYTVDLEVCGFVNPDGSHVIVVLNRTGSDIGFTLCTEGGALKRRTCACTSSAHSIMTIVI